MAPSLSVVIPTLNAAGEIDELLTLIETQTLRPFDILVVDSSSEDGTVDEVAKHPRVNFVRIERKEFNHGLTRDIALRHTAGDFVCFLTQDAVPASSRYLETLVEPLLADNSVALVSGRQLPKANARRFEQLVRDFNYPDTPSVRSKGDLEKFGIKTFFASDTCSAYRRTAYLECGGFDHVNTNEDMLMAAKFIASGMKVAYEPRAEVYHSHNLTPSQQFARNRAVGFFLETHADDLMQASEIGEGGRLVKAVSSQLLREGNLVEFIAFAVGYWQLYVFYVSYVGFFHLGLSSGVYLTTGGQKREEMDKASIKSQMLFGVFYQTFMAIVIVSLSSFLQTGAERTFVVVMTAIYLVLQNLATFMMNELQCMNETKKSSFSTIIERLAFLVPLLVLLVLRIDSFYPYVFAYTASTLMQLGYCVWNLRDFWEAEWLGLRRAARLGWASIKIGFPMMLANVMSMLILGIGRVFIDARWGIETFGKLSLALSLVSFFLAFVSQASMVLFPSLRQATLDEVRRFYRAARDAMGLLFPGVYALYFPMVWLLSMWLPDYSSTFTYLILLLPICVFDSKYNITGVTYYNVLRRERVMLLVNMVSAFTCLILTLLAVYAFGSVFAVISVMTVVIVARSLWSEFYMNRLMKVPASSIGAAEIMLTVGFILSAFFYHQCRLSACILRFIWRF